eukprot:TRINITY_DN68704_c0_g1_i1.p1 TRINITY_DN68704_c0_g1~~TRINITY_DN68704_c0_g1_i1.p1  ORF type:complete len:558 (-),score=47.40 TRINITY_DN68704_c0_g1_i1:94-1767(-)
MTMVVLSLLLFVAVCSVNAAFPEAKTTSGMVRGIAVNNKWGNIHSWAWKGIPYAASPEGSLRWKSPQPAKSWTGVKVTDRWGHACPQVCTLPNITCPNAGPDPTTYSEDCLFLNVFAPYGATPSSNLNVMFFIHGGDFKQGAGGEDLYDADFFAHFTNQVFVTINYRLGALGWMTHPTMKIPTNLGILDQRAALNWVKHNIANFGGNPKQVTVWGQSAGSMSVATHMTTARSVGLFTAAIGESNPFAIGFKSAEKANKIGVAMGENLLCGTKDTPAAKMWECMQKRPVHDILVAQDVVEAEFLPIHLHVWEWVVFWAPTIDGEDLKGNPLTEISKGNFHKDTPYMLGYNKDDARPYAYKILELPMHKWELDLLVPVFFGEKYAKQIIDAYPIPSNETHDCRDDMSNLISDYTFACGTWEAARQIARHGGQAYLYNYSHALSFKQAWGPKYKFCEDYACHAAELPILFNSVNMSKKYHEQRDEQVLSRWLESLWTQLNDKGKEGEPLLAYKSKVPWKPVEANSSTTNTMVLWTGADLLMWQEYADKMCPLWQKVGFYH